MAGATIATWVKVRTKTGLTSRPISHKYEGGAGFEKGQVITQSEYNAIVANRKEKEKSGNAIGSFSELEKRWKGASEDAFREDIPAAKISMRGQGKRVKGMVMGGMASLHQTPVVSVLAKLPLSKTEKQEVSLLDRFDQRNYAKARGTGLNHDQSMVITYKLMDGAGLSEAYSAMKKLSK